MAPSLRTLAAAIVVAGLPVSGRGAEPRRPTKDTRMAAPEPAPVALKEGVAVELASGVTLTLESTMYAHLSGSRNSALVKLRVARGAQAEEVTLERLWPGPPKYTAVLGVKLAIDWVDAYHQPSSATILVSAN